jgi:5-methylcytosine-specific restriction enzyme subunit McrC
MLIKEINLFEFQKYNWDYIFDDLAIKNNKDLFKEHFEEILQMIWIDRYNYIPNENLYNNSTSKDQRFFEITSLFIKPKNYTGSIEFKFEEILYRFNILPKIFYIDSYSYQNEHYNSIQLHTLWWLSEIIDIIPPSYQTSLDELNTTNIIEIYIYLFSSFTLQILENDSYKYYNDINEDLNTIKGKINFTNYINNYTKGSHHIINCDFDDFTVDNQFNQIIKYVTNLVKPYTSNRYTIQKLNDILFILDDVSDVQVISSDCDKVILNAIFSEYKTILDYCRLFLNGTTSYSNHHKYDVFALIIPTEKLFEKLIRKFCNEIDDKNFKGIITKRPGRGYLAEEIMPDYSKENRFKLVNDIIIKTEDDYIIIDTKYKTLNESEKDKGIKQTDMYQMVGYAISSGIKSIKLIYPSKIFGTSAIISNYTINDLFTLDTHILVNALQIKIISTEPFSIKLEHETLENIFKKLKNEIILDLKHLILNKEARTYTLDSNHIAIQNVAEQKSDYN